MRSIVIDILAIADPVEGNRIPDESELAWLCFYAPQPENTLVKLNGKKLPVIMNAPDDTGMGSVSLPGGPVPDVRALYA